MDRRTQTPELPGLNASINLLETEDRARYAIHALVLDHCLGTDSDVYWIDASGMASAHPLTKLAPRERVLQSVQVSRAQTSYQHMALIEHFQECVDDDIELLCLTGMDVHYRDHDRGHESGKEALVSSIASVAGVSRDHDLPVLLTRYRSDEFSEPLENAAGEVIEYQSTRMGPRFVGEDFETLVYPRKGGFQTTLAYWQRILEARYAEQQKSTSPWRPDAVDV